MSADTVAGPKYLVNNLVNRVSDDVEYDAPVKPDKLIKL